MMRFGIATSILTLVGCQFTEQVSDSTYTPDTAIEHTALIDTAPPLSECEQLAQLNPSVTVGTGEFAYETVAPGETLDVVYGPQGGWHIYGSLRTTGLKAGPVDDLFHIDTPRVTFEVHDEVGMFAGYAELPRPMVAHEQGVLELVGELLILWVSTPEPYYDREVTMRVQVTDGCGSVVTDETTVTLIPEIL